MQLKPDHPEKTFIAQAQKVLIQAKNQSEIALRLAEFGYTEEKINEGLQIYQNASTLIDVALNNDLKKNTQFREYQLVKHQLEKLYQQHRQKAKIIFRKSPDVLTMLNLTGSIPFSYTEWKNTLISFYSGILANPVLQQRLIRFKIPMSEIKQGQQLLRSLEIYRNRYINENGLPNEAVIEESEIMVTLDHWLDDFLIAAEFALEDKPQLLKKLRFKKISHR
ncbi:MAG TPA: hypothetical protein DCQ26_02290 [Marinilabiliales bacterium]|jgi:hypothetical protein|nr:MAG: hypothetical protein A2W95_18650 [Bacteroidetes bacterium GWA2_40_14]OFX58444.1 MAG: hypothetical protein A2W84_10315 [Bacteroidetes bacterium GWC2_40_13]OFX71480.1 MAG: hypothetical protein A2W96_14705 [Bacteroidetes bacterium GWD2_40_43]OFX89492.1 MAG: hypothetical protein A2W97_14150 [Bacteroidetes bacterium GWE2_40_63]OFY23317.1 MAG: hypothetical protein A2W88_19810 [Bacteroidetes bacterium GWF2_40_13]OFZ28071.1 MAG: hypothetical protein A2437_04175 [Bacteroidetes bacterium RIFOXYC